MNIKLQEQLSLQLPSHLPSQDKSSMLFLLFSQLSKSNPANISIQSLLTLFDSSSPDSSTLPVTFHTLPPQPLPLLTQYANFLRKIPSLPSDLKSSLKKQKFLCLLFALRQLILHHGGFPHVLASNQWSTILLQTLTNYKIPSFLHHPATTEKLYFELYKLMMFPYDLYESKHLIAPQKVNIGLPEFYTKKDILKFQYERVGGIWEKEVFAVTDVIRDCGVRGNVFSEEKICGDVGERVVAVGVYAGKTEGPVEKKRVVEMSVGKYLEYCKGKYTGLDKGIRQEVERKEVVLIADPIPLPATPYLEELHKLPPLLTFQNPLNTLHSPTPLPSYPPLSLQIASPSSYLPLTSSHITKTCLVSLNHGPSDLLWSLLPLSSLPSLRTLLLRTSSTDPLLHPTLPSPLLLSLHNLPVKQILQKPGTLIFINSGMLYWNQSHGYSLHTTWHLLPLSKPLLSKVIQYNDMDTTHKFPIKQLALNILNTKYYLNSPLIGYLLEMVEKWVKKEEMEKEGVVRKMMEGVEVKMGVGMGVDACGVCGGEVLCVRWRVKGMKTGWCGECYGKYKGVGVVVEDRALLVHGFLARVKRERRCSQGTEPIIPGGWKDPDQGQNTLLVSETTNIRSSQQESKVSLMLCEDRKEQEGSVGGNSKSKTPWEFINEQEAEIIVEEETKGDLTHTNKPKNPSIKISPAGQQASNVMVKTKELLVVNPPEPVNLFDNPKPSPSTFNNLVNQPEQKSYQNHHANSNQYNPNGNRQTKISNCFAQSNNSYQSSTYQPANTTTTDFSSRQNQNTNRNFNKTDPNLHPTNNNSSINSKHSTFHQNNNQQRNQQQKDSYNFNNKNTLENLNNYEANRNTTNSFKNHSQNQSHHSNNNNHNGKYSRNTNNNQYNNNNNDRNQERRAMMFSPERGTARSPEPIINLMEREEENVNQVSNKHYNNSHHQDNKGQTRPNSNNMNNFKSTRDQPQEASHPNLHQTQRPQYPAYDQKSARNHPQNRSEIPQNPPSNTKYPPSQPARQGSGQIIKLPKQSASTNIDF